MNQKYRKDLNAARKELFDVKKELVSLFEEVMLSVKTVPKYAGPVIKVSQEVDTAKPVTLINGLKEINHYFISSLKENQEASINH